MRKISSLNLVVLLVAILLFFFIAFYYFDLGNYFKRSSALAEQQQAMEQADILLVHAKPEEALKIIHRYTNEMDARSSTSEAWLDLLLRAAVESHDVYQLLSIYQKYPDSFTYNESASLLVADGYLTLGKSEGYENLRRQWENRAKSEDRWFLLDADNLVIQGKPQEAIAMLKSKSFSGKADAPRLLRLSLLHVNDQPKLAWDYLTEAAKKNPDNPDLRSHRARLLESVGKSQLALSEYLTAIELAPRNPHFKDQLADFYFRQKQYLQMLPVLQQTLFENATDRLWLKSLFWNKVVAPLHFDWSSASLPDGHLRPLVSYVLSLPHGIFWSKNKFDRDPELSSYLKTEQATFWLQLIQQLKEGNETEALNLLQYNPFAAQSWEPQLEEALKMILIYRKTGSLTLDQDNQEEENLNENDFTKAMLGKVSSHHPLFLTLNEYKKRQNSFSSLTPLPESWHDLLLSEEAFSVAFIASGWLEAGLQLHRLNIFPGNFPDWAAYDLTQAIKSNRNNFEALEFVSNQKRTPATQLLTGETLIAIGNQEAGLRELSQLANQNYEESTQASWLIALIYIDQGKYEEAKMLISSKSTLQDSVKGQEVLARIALLQGDLPLADKIYSSLEENSIEAKSYLARKAFAERKWKKAQDLTEDLIRIYPNNEVLRQNLKKIIEEEQFSDHNVQAE